MTVRNKRLAGGSVSGAGVHDVYTVPALTVALVKLIRLRNNSGGATSWSVGCRSATNSPSTDLAANVSGVNLANQASDGWAGWVALIAGDKIYVNLGNGGPFDYWVSGAELL